MAFRLGREKNRALLLYFAGHGETLDLADGTQLGYIIPTDCPLKARDPMGFDEKAVSMREIEALALKVKSVHLLAMFDSCFSGSLFSLTRAAPVPRGPPPSRPTPPCWPCSRTCIAPSTTATKASSTTPSGQSAVWRVPADGGEETEVLAEPIGHGNWALGRSGVYFSGRQRQVGRQQWWLRHLDLGSGQVTELFRTEGPFLRMWLAVSPDEERILYGEWPLATSELMLVENFR